MDKVLEMIFRVFRGRDWSRRKNKWKHLKAELLGFQIPNSFSTLMNPTTLLCVASSCAWILIETGRNWLHLCGDRRKSILLAIIAMPLLLLSYYCFAIYFHWTHHLSMAAIENDKTIFIFLSPWLTLFSAPLLRLSSTLLLDFYLNINFFPRTQWCT